MTGYVYAVQSGDAVKIGWAKDPVRRLAELNVGSPERHLLLGFARGTKEHERELHKLCAKERIRGEWFRKGRVVSLFLDHLPPPPVPIVPDRHLIPVELIMRAFGGPAKFGRIIGKPTEHAAAMRRRRSIPVQYWPAIVDAATAKGLSLTPSDLMEAHASASQNDKGAA